MMAMCENNYKLMETKSRIFPAVLIVKKGKLGCRDLNPDKRNQNPSCCQLHYTPLGLIDLIDVFDIIQRDSEKKP